MHQTEFVVQSRGVGLYEVTREICGWVADSGCEAGLLTLLVRHTSCSLLIQENADPDVQADLKEFFAQLVPRGDDASMRWLTHVLEGPDDMPAHIKAALLPVTLSIPV
ncbi:MAG: YjbQ family protein, partial [Spongiibacter sp.]|uniref:secondary thiamine-phosphate synthase enzyme YjbQ n=1 Tax=Spongiibacter sp. TaxID=2024860 RepID=UPI001B11B027